MDGRHDFDFWTGRWQQHNRKLADVSEPGCTEWIEFGSETVAWQVLGGLGNVDTFSTNDFPGVGAFKGMSLRLFDPEHKLWRIWWASSTRAGELDVPVEGRFDNGHGVFECADELFGRKITVRYEWLVYNENSARWQQSFSYDGGQNWEPNWVTDHTRLA